MASSHSTHATTASSNGWSTKRIAILAMLCAAAAISTMVLQFPLIPGVTFLKYDPSGVFALQFHPEVAHTAIGTDILKNFIFNICGCEPSWTVQSFIETTVAAIRGRRSGNGRTRAGRRLLRARTGLAPFLGASPLAVFP